MILDNVRFEVEDGIATITLNRPESMNAMTLEMLRDLGAALTETRRRVGRDIRALILTGAGRAFSVGGDVKGMSADGRTPLEQRERLRANHQCISDLYGLELPVISLVDGAAAGMGANVALAADFVFATKRAMFMQAFGRLGLIPDFGGLYVLPRLVGLQRAKELVFTARKVPAREALELGLVYRIVDEAQAMEEARRFAARFRAASTTAIGLAKNTLNQSFNLDLRGLLEIEAAAQGLCVSSDYFRDAVGRFAARQPALFDWETSETDQDPGASGTV